MYTDCKKRMTVLKEKLLPLDLNEVIFNFIVLIYGKYLESKLNEFTLEMLSNYLYENKEKIEILVSVVALEKFLKKGNYSLILSIRKIRKIFKLSEEDFLSQNGPEGEERYGEYLLIIFFDRIKNELVFARENRANNQVRIINCPEPEVEAYKYKTINDNRTVGPEFYGSLHQITE